MRLIYLRAFTFIFWNISANPNVALVVCVQELIRENFAADHLEKCLALCNASPTPSNTAALNMAKLQFSCQQLAGVVGPLAFFLANFLIVRDF